MTIERIAFEAGFRKADEIHTSAIGEAEVLGLELIESSIMPEGWVGLRTDKGALCFGPGGMIWVPAFNFEEFAARPMTINQEDHRGGV